ncbi:excinuclease ABC subunit B [Marivita hallyeonensis]|uniref:excinuclease ABC subunit B n=1 Tax=Marivita hallyeonensis TaxID=996342 RepID=UPI001FE95FC3|nr:excinuclease ABC subunit B [Marivita hallyeonensis]
MSDATAPYRAALKERATISETLARGYAYKTEFVTRRVFTRCYHGRDTYIPCWKNETIPITRRVSIDRAALTAREAELARRLPSLARAAERGTQTCNTLYAVSDA